jgi:hypothetical protein
MTAASRAARGLLVVGVMIAAGSTACTRHRDRFWPDTDNGKLALSSPQVLAGDPDRLIHLHPTGGFGETSAVPRLSHTLRVGDRVVASVSVPRVGEYRSGGGWIFHGKKYFGRYGVAGDLLVVTSDRPGVMIATTDQHGNLEVDALAPGVSRVTLTATMSRRYADRPADAETLTDTVAFVVQP